MYSVVLATVLTTGGAAPDLGFGLSFSFHAFHGCHGCYGSCHGCWGSCRGCYGCYGSCHGCSGCWGSCHGCYGSGYMGSYAAAVPSVGSLDCYGCYGSSCYGCYGCSGWAWSCHGCYGVVAAPAAKVAAPASEKLPDPKPASMNLKAAPATVIVKAPLGMRVTVNGTPTTRAKAEETFTTPDLQPGRNYAYDFRAEMMRDGEPVVIDRRVYVRAGGRARIEFQEPAVSAAARVTVVLPADARLAVNGVNYPAGKARRTFETPRLEVGRQYHYTLKAEVERDGRTHKSSKRVTVTPGKALTVSFSDLPTVRTVSR